MQPISANPVRRLWLGRLPSRLLMVAAALLAAVATTRADAQSSAQYEIAVSPVAVEPAAPEAGQRATLAVVVRIRPLTPVSRPLVVNLRVLFLRMPSGDAPAPAATTLGEQATTMRIGEVTRVSIPWLVEPGSHALLARAEIPPGQRIDAGDVQLASAPATALAVPAAPPLRAPLVNVVRPQNSAEPGRTVREPSAGEGPASVDRRIATAALGIVGAREPAAAVGGLVIDVPLYVLNAPAVRAVGVRCNVFAQTFGDLIGTGQVMRPVAGGDFAETVAVPITPRPGRARSRSARYSCLATYATDGPALEDPSQLPGGPAGTAGRRAVYERRFGRTFVSFSDLIEGEIDPR